MHYDDLGSKYCPFCNSPDIIIVQSLMDILTHYRRVHIILRICYILILLNSWLARLIHSYLIFFKIHKNLFNKSYIEGYLDYFRIFSVKYQQ
jgi:hypothetical protein